MHAPLVYRIDGKSGVARLSVRQSGVAYTTGQVEESATETDTGSLFAGPWTDEAQRQISVLRKEISDMCRALELQESVLKNFRDGF